VLIASLAQAGTTDMIPRLVWELNLTTLLTFGAGCVAFYVGVIRLGDAIKAGNAKIVEAQQAIEHWKLQFLALKAEHDVFKEKVITEYVRKPELDKVADRLFDKIEEQGKETIKAINGIYERLLDDAKADRKTGR
jgi:hypothetical protein